MNPLMALPKKVKEALKKAKELEKKEPMTKEELVTAYKEGVSLSEKMRNLLVPSWFVKDIHQKPAVKPVKKKSGQKKPVAGKKRKL